MKSEGRLVGHNRVGAGFLDTNIVPRLMTLAQLQSGGRWLLNKIYSPGMFGRRVKAFADICGLKQLPGARPVPFTPMELALAKGLARSGSETRELLRLMEMLIRLRPELRSQILYCLIYYCQIRYMLNVTGIWNPELARQSRPLMPMQWR